MRKIIELPIEETKAVVGGATLSASYSAPATMAAPSTSVVASTTYNLPVFQSPVVKR